MTHGTIYSYKHRGCRCDVCRAGNAARVARYREKRASDPNYVSNPERVETGRIGARRRWLNHEAIVVNLEGLTDDQRREVRALIWRMREARQPEPIA